MLTNNKTAKKKNLQFVMRNCTLKWLLFDSSEAFAYFTDSPLGCPVGKIFFHVNVSIIFFPSEVQCSIFTDPFLLLHQPFLYKEENLLYLFFLPN